MKKYKSFERNSLVSSDLYLIGKLFGQVWFGFFLVKKAGYCVIPWCSHFSSSLENFTSRNSSVCSSAVKHFYFFLVLVILRSYKEICVLYGWWLNDHEAFLQPVVCQGALGRWEQCRGFRYGPETLTLLLGNVAAHKQRSIPDLNTSNSPSLETEQNFIEFAL